MSNMSQEILYVQGNVTAQVTGTSTGLAVGLTFFFLILGIVAGVVAYKRCSKSRNMLQSPQRSSQKKEHYSRTTQDDSHQYTTMHRDQSIPQTPIYENLSRTTRRLSGDPGEDLYLQCDISDDAIYSNDPKCNFTILPPPQEEDVYLMPDS